MRYCDHNGRPIAGALFLNWSQAAELVPRPVELLIQGIASFLSLCYSFTVRIRLGSMIARTTIAVRTL
jgi:hypothetical protein